MLAALDVLLAQPLLLLIILAAGAGIGVGVEKFTAGIERDRRRAYWAGRKGARGHRSHEVVGHTKQNRRREGIDAADQLRIVQDAHFTARPLLNKPEAKLFAALDREVIARNPAWQVMAQVCIGEFLASDDSDAYGCVNSKRVDFALMDPSCRVRHALEYQGSGHHLPGGSAAARDAVKKEALRKAGIGYHEVIADQTTLRDLRAVIAKLVPPPPRREPEMERESERSHDPAS